MEKIKSPLLSIYLLLALLFFQGASGMFGGAALIIDPSGGLLGLPLDMLAGSPFKTYLMPGIILLLVLGVFPLIVFYGLWQRKEWAWLGAVVVGMALIVWLANGRLSLRTTIAAHLWGSGGDIAASYANAICSYVR